MRASVHDAVQVNAQVRITPTTTHTKWTGNRGSHHIAVAVVERYVRWAAHGRATVKVTDIVRTHHRHGATFLRSNRVDVEAAVEWTVASYI